MIAFDAPIEGQRYRLTLGHLAICDAAVTLLHLNDVRVREKDGAAVGLRTLDCLSVREVTPPVFAATII